MHYFISLFGIIFMSIIVNKECLSTDDKASYVLETGKAAERGLEAQHKILAQDSLEQLKKAGLKENQVVWDVGCGSGTMTEYLAQTVGDLGHVYAIDISPDQIKVSRERIERKGLKNVTFINADVSLINLPEGTADIIFARLVLMHMKHPERAIQKMYASLKPGGYLLLNESIMSSSYSSPACGAMDGYTKTVLALGKHKGVDFDIGARLEDLCKEAHFTSIEHYCLQKKLNAKEAQVLLVVRSAEWKEEAIRAGITTEAQMDQWDREFKDFFSNEDPSYYIAMSKQAFIIARK